jgi:methyl-accepting chemotaxis protein
MYLDSNGINHNFLDLTLKSRKCIANQLSLNPYIIGKDNCCELGEWLYGEGKSNYSNLKSYLEVLNIHAEFHLEAKKIAFATREKSQLEVAAMMKDGSVFSVLVLQIAQSIDHLKREIEMG